MQWFYKVKTTPTSKQEEKRNYCEELLSSYCQCMGESKTKQCKTRVRYKTKSTDAIELENWDSRETHRLVGNRDRPTSPPPPHKAAAAADTDADDRSTSKSNTTTTTTTGRWATEMTSSSGVGGRYMAYSPSLSAPLSPHISGLRSSSAAALVAEQEK